MIRVNDDKPLDNMTAPLGLSVFRENGKTVVFLLHAAGKAFYPARTVGETRF